MLLEKIAAQLNVSPETLERESLRVYLQRQVRLIAGVSGENRGS